MPGKSTHHHNISLTKSFFHLILSVFVLRVAGSSFGVLSFWKARKPFSYQFYFHQLLGGKKNVKRNLLIPENSQMNLTLPFTPNPCHSCKKEKDSDKNKTFYKFLIIPFCWWWTIQAFCILKEIFHYSHLLIHILHHIKGHTQHTQR